MISLDLKDLFDQLDRDLAALDGQRGEVLWRAIRSGAGPDAAAGEDAVDRHFSDDAVLTRLESVYRREGFDAVARRRAALWLSRALVRRAGRAPGYRARWRRVGTMVESFRGLVGRERPGLDDLRLILRRDRDRGRREQAYTSLGALGRGLATAVGEALATQAAAWAPGRNGDRTAYWRQPLSPFGLDWPNVDVSSLAAEFLELTHPLLDRALAGLGRFAGVRTLRPWDLDYATAGLAAGYNRYFAESELAPSLARALRAVGLPVDSQPLRPELSPGWLPLANSGWPAVDWIAVPTRPGPAAAWGNQGRSGLVRPAIGVAVDPRAGSQWTLAGLANATGVGLGLLHNRGGHLAGRAGALGLTPGALAISGLLTEPNFLAGQTSLPRSELPRYLALGCIRSGLLRAVWLRSAAARAAAAWAVMSEPGCAPGPAWADWLSRATGLTYEPDLFALDTATLAEPGFWPRLFVAELGAGQVLDYLRREHGRLMGDRRTAECLIECFYRHGALAPAAGAVELATGQPFGLRSEVEQLKVAAG